MKFFLTFFLSLVFALNSFSQNQSKIDNYLDTAALFKESGEYEKARDVLDSVGADEKTVQYQAKLSFLRGESEEALREFESIKDKNWVDFLYQGLIYEDLNKLDLALDNYSKSLELKPNSIALFRLAKICRSSGEYEKAADFFQKLINLDSSIRLAYYYLGDSFLRLKQYKQAYEFLSKASDFYPQVEIIKKSFLTVKEELGGEFFTERKKEAEEKRKKVELPYYEPLEGLAFIKVGLAKDLSEFSFSCKDDFVIKAESKVFKGQGAKLYKITFKEGKIFISGYDDKTVYENFFAPFKVSSLGSKKRKGPFYILDIIFDKGNFWHKKIDRAYRGDLEVIIRNNKITLINILSVEEYLYGVLPAEIPRLSAQEALRAQAIAARTFAFKNLSRHEKEGFDLCADVHCQAYGGILSEFFTTNNAVNDTKGLILTKEDKPMEVFYHSNCGGCLGSDTFGDNEDLCRVDSESGDIPNSAYQEEQWFLEEPAGFCCHSGQAKGRWQRVYDKEDFAIAFGYDLEELKAIQFIEKGSCFRYKKIDVLTSAGVESLTSGFKIRQYFDNLKSSAFKFEIKSSLENKPRMLFFWGAGFGHGVGLCQQGAMEMGKKGYSCQQILQHYYPSSIPKKLY